MEDKLARGFLFFAAVCRHADGHFTQDCTMDEMIEVCVQYLDEFNKNTGQNLTADEYRQQLRQYFPTLKRWQKN